MMNSRRLTTRPPVAALREDAQAPGFLVTVGEVVELCDWIVRLEDALRALAVEAAGMDMQIENEFGVGDKPIAVPEIVVAEELLAQVPLEETR